MYLCVTSRYNPIHNCITTVFFVLRLMNISSAEGRFRKNHAVLNRLQTEVSNPCNIFLVKIICITIPVL